MEEKKLAELIKGDEVIMYGGGGFLSLENVERVTKTQIIVCGYKFNKETGKLCGADVWSMKFIKVPEQKDLDELRLRKLRESLRKRIRQLDNQILGMDEESVNRFLTLLNY